MTKSIINEVNNLLEEPGLLVVATVSDLGQTNRGLFNEQGVNNAKPSFQSGSGRDIFVYCDVPHSNVSEITLWTKALSTKEQSI